MVRTENKTQKIHYDSFHIAGFSYWDGCEAFEMLRIGAKLRLEREDDNKFDPYAVAIYFRDIKLGYVPRGKNEDISKFLDMGYDDIFETRITRISPDQHPENQVSVNIYLKNNDRQNTYENRPENERHR